ncbi:MAG: hypothetical protein F2785_03920 [Actinobacteria bacterium]|jgi:hypothetical protein|uniref:Unannotated protein n=1 Tax=freshwater metagenome TaxID=449393 RepID=A0A6J7DLD5_9ZZZZ|nr:hypothetical protein [Actinomycetota bacterium]
MLARVLLIGSFVIIAVMIYAIVDVAVTPASKVRGLPKPLWFVVLVVFPLIGAILWFIMGKGRRGATTKPVTPTDIVDRGPTSGPFSTESVDDRIARLEEELRRLDEEGENPPKDSA